MPTKIYSVILATGSYIPNKIVLNDSFLSSEFFDQDKKPIDIPNSDIIEKFRKITNIEERRYIDEAMVNSDMAFCAAEAALDSAGINPETLDGIFVAHNFGDIRNDNRKTDMVPSLASRVKFKLGVKNPKTVAFDVIFGCPGWLQCVILADQQIRLGEAKRIMVIGADTLSRVSDPYDRDSLIYADGAGAIILEAKESDVPVGIIAHEARTDALHESQFLEMSGSYKPSFEGTDIYLKMQGRKLYEYALSNVPQLVKDCIEKAGLYIDDIKKVLIHQANEKMDEAILQRIFKLYGIFKVPDDIMPMTINKLGNSSVATLPTLLDLILKGILPGHQLQGGDNVIFASVGAGMNINAFAYRFPIK